VTTGVLEMEKLGSNDNTEQWWCDRILGMHETLPGGISGVIVGCNG